MPDQEVATALVHWAPRMVQNGVDYSDLTATVARIDRWADWLPQ